MKRLSILLLTMSIAALGCSKPSSSETTRSPGFVEEEPHINTGTGGVGSGPTGTGGSEPTDVPPTPR